MASIDTGVIEVKMPVNIIKCTIWGSDVAVAKQFAYPHPHHSY